MKLIEFNLKAKNNKPTPKKIFINDEVLAVIQSHNTFDITNNTVAVNTGYYITTGTLVMEGLNHFLVYD